MRFTPAILWLGLSACSSSPAPPPQPDSSSPRDSAAREAPTRKDSVPATDRTLPDTEPRPPAKWVSVSGAPPLLYHTATLLKDGRVLIVGGERREKTGPAALVPATHLFDPKSGSFGSGGTLAAPRAHHTATLLADGRVLAVGGSGEGATALLATEIFDPAKPAAQAWSSGPPIPGAREGHSAELLSDGKLLIAGGKAGATVHDGFLIFDPVSGAWSAPLFKLDLGRTDHASLALPDGRVLFAGGTDGKVFTSTLEILQPKTGTVTALAAKLAKGRSQLTASRLPDGRIALVGGWCGFGCAVTSDDLYDPATDQVAGLSHFGDPPGFHAAVTLQDGRVLAIGGVSDRAAPTGTSTVVALSPAGWQQLPSLAEARFRHTATLLADGTVLVVGGTESLTAPYRDLAERLFP